MFHSNRKILCHGCWLLRRVINNQSINSPFLLQQRLLFSSKATIARSEWTVCLFSFRKQHRYSNLNFSLIPHKRTFSFSSFCFQNVKNSTATQTIIDDTPNDPSVTKIPFVYSQKSSPSDKEQQTSSDKTVSDEQKELTSRTTHGVRILKYTAYFLGVWLVSTLSYIVLAWGTSELDQEGNVVLDEYSHLPVWKQYLKRSFKGVIDYWQTIKEPTTDKLLPDPLPAPYQPPYTLAIEMSGILLNPEWTSETGWRYEKRPGLDYFLKEIGYPVYEVVIYTKETLWTATPVIDVMNAEHQIMYRLFRENTRFINGTYIKDLSRLNRDLKRIIFLDWDEAAYSLQPRNALHHLKRWNGNDDDRTLLHLATFLKTIAVSGVEDIRDILDQYNQENEPLEAFLIRQKELLEAEEQKHQTVSTTKTKPTKGLFSGWKPL